MSQKSLQEQREQRLRNLEALRERGFEAYPYRYRASHRAAELHAAHPDPEPGSEPGGEPVTVAGRTMLLRKLGKLTFATLQDASGRIQVSFQKDMLERYNALKKVDLGDWLEVTGPLYVTQTGELTVRSTDFRPLVKSLRPLPDKHHGLSSNVHKSAQ
jgi:lysyl-tRNA synthetase class 2